MATFDSKVNSRLVLIIKLALKIFTVLFIIISLVPYLIPLQQLSGARHEQVFPNSVFAEVDDTEVHYSQWGEKSAEKANILLVHGMGGSTFSWRYTAPYLGAAGYHVIAVDLPGFGLSERKKGLDHSSDVRAELLWLLLDSLDPGEHWHLIGHSMGGAAVTAMALQQPDRVKSLTLAAGALAAFESSPRIILLKYPPFGRWLRVLAPRVLLTEKRVEQLLLSAYGRQPTMEEIEGYYRPLTLKNTDAVLIDLVNTAPTPLIDRVGTLEIPVLCIWGEDDTWVPLERGRDLVRMIEEAELVVLPSEGHCPMETSPDLFNRELLRFIKTIS